MVPMKLNVLVAMYCFAGNGGVATVIPEIAFWLAKLNKELAEDPRIDRVAVTKAGDIPLTMARNEVVKKAMDNGFDVILMLDSDNQPDLYDGKKDWAKPFWKTSFDFLYERACRGLPTVVCSPYCGPPPHPTGGGEENVYVFYAADYETGRLENAFHFKAYDRLTASQMRGIQEIAAGPTGVILYSTDAFRLMPIGEMSDGQVLDGYAKGEISQERALRLLRMKSWFFYEFTDQYQTQKASTEDVTNTREIQMAGIKKFGEPVVFCNWDAWAGHLKPKCVGMPEPISMTQISETYIEAVHNNLGGGDELRELNFADVKPERQVRPEPLVEEPPEGRERPWNLQSRMLYGRKITTIGTVFPEESLEAIRQHVSRNTQQLYRVIVVGAGDGDVVWALAEKMGPDGGNIFCIDEWDDASLQRFVGNIGELVDTSVRVIDGDTLNTANTFPDRQDVDLILLLGIAAFSDAIDAIHSWSRHLSPRGHLILSWLKAKGPEWNSYPNDLKTTVGEMFSAFSMADYLRFMEGGAADAAQESKTAESV
ncbi:class I SAM-dependent methyltransferase [Planctomicrobium piriforme]|uniref:Methyltransferase domain-containing protein n=1 Tax=Planctomicrobium piriforme TaxID=1576369 RepID=A0A1I3ED89_9PLAN|nr:class I SAM-dependent methyltransferase [Planctomicrobium piriforme]SFH96934.1 hypothetical protein SAMN05421753_104173 [Planctomicrobium piriforme]